MRFNKNKNYIYTKQNMKENIVQNIIFSIWERPKLFFGNVPNWFFSIWDVPKYKKNNLGRSQMQKKQFGTFPKLIKFIPEPYLSKYFLLIFIVPIVNRLYLSSLLNHKRFFCIISVFFKHYLIRIIVERVIYSRRWF